MLKLNELKGREYGKLFFLTEDNDITDAQSASSFIYKYKTSEGFNEYYGVIVNPNADVSDVINIKESKIDLANNLESLYKLYNLNKKFVFGFKDRDIPIYVPKDYLEFTPNSWFGVKRTKETAASNGKTRQESIYNFYKENLNLRHVHSLKRVKATSVSWLYYYLHDGNEFWEPGFERFGYVDGLWELGGYVTVAIDSGEFRIHTAVHELGHSMSYYLSNKYFNAYMEIARDKTERPPTEYGKTDIAEDYAEAYAFYFCGEKSREVLRKKCIKRYMFMKDIDRAGKSALISTPLEPNQPLSMRFRGFDEAIYKDTEHIYGY